MSARPPLVILGNPENRRVEFARRAAGSQGWQDVETVPWLAFLANPAKLTAKMRPGGWLRIESPGENFEVEKALLRFGSAPIAGTPWAQLDARAIDALLFRRGQILPMRQWFLGWQHALAEVNRCLQETGCRAMNPPEDIAAMFDKARCHELLATAGVPLPRLLGLPESYVHLREIMQVAGCARVFLKPCHSSSASGVVALEAGRAGVQAFSTVEMAGGPGGSAELFNSLNVRRYRAPGEIAALVDAVCRQRCIAEQWFPKAGHGGQRFDLRVLVIGGRAAHTVMRQSAGPITNLHLGNRRGDLAALRQRMGEAAWQNVLAVAEHAASAFPRSLYVAVDLLVAPDFRRFAVAEVNAFGDLLPNLLHDGQDTYTAELAHLLASASAAPSAQVSTSG